MSWSFTQFKYSQARLGAPFRRELLKELFFGQALALHENITLSFK
jgi:hypothetical protein